jgi:hypothetical protein
MQNPDQASHEKKEANITIKSRKKAGKPKHSAALPKVKDDCKESVQLTNTLHIQELRDLVNSFKK